MNFISYLENPKTNDKKNSGNRKNTRYPVILREIGFIKIEREIQLDD